jgi:hypothetical protein
MSPHDLIDLPSAQETRHAAEIAVMRAQVAELERRLSSNCSNSGKPPSSDGLKKPARVSSLREHSGKKPGGQKGYPEKAWRLVDNFMWASDYPHHEGTWPHSAAAMERTMPKLSEMQQAKLLGLNAVRFFKLEVPEHQRLAA